MDAFPVLLALVKIKTLGTSGRDFPMLIDSWSLPDSRVWRVGFTGYQRHKGSEFPPCLTCRLSWSQSPRNAAHPRARTNLTWFSCSSASAVQASKGATAPHPLLDLLLLSRNKK